MPVECAVKHNVLQHLGHRYLSPVVPPTISPPTQGVEIPGGAQVQEILGGACKSEEVQGSQGKARRSRGPRRRGLWEPKRNRMEGSLDFDKSLDFLMVAASARGPV